MNEPIVRDIIQEYYNEKDVIYFEKLSYNQKLSCCKQIINSDDLCKFSCIKLTDNEKDKLKEVLKRHILIMTNNLDFTVLIKLLKFYEYNKTCFPNIKNLYVRLLNETSHIDEEKKLVYDLMTNDDLTSAQQVKIFCTETGKGRSTFYTIKKKIVNEIKK